MKRAVFFPALFVLAAFAPVVVSAANPETATSTSAAVMDHAPLPSSVFDWDSLTAKPTGVGERRDVADRPTKTLGIFECHISTLNPGQISHPPHQHSQEELILLRSGVLEVSINGSTTKVGPGSLFFFASNDFHNVKNVGDVPATYVVLNFTTQATASAPKLEAAKSAPATALRSGVFDWAKIPVKSTEVGARREFFDSPTVTCRNLECHATTIHSGKSPHAPHHHPDEEFVVVKEGEIEVTIEGQAKHIGPGSIAFFSSNDQHGIKNVGSVDATYYILRVVTDKTPKH